MGDRRRRACLTRAHHDGVRVALRRDLDSMPQFAGSQVIYGGSAGPGLFTELKDGVDGLFLGRFAHDPAAVELILDETGRRAPDLRRRPP